MDDSTLIEQIQQGSKDAFKQMFIKFYSPLCEYASQYVSDEDAEELIQELMLFIWENRNSLFVEISLKSYFFMAVKHRCLNAIKKQLYDERVHDLIYDKIKDQFENPDTYFVKTSLQRISRKRSKNCLRIIERHLNLADSESNLISKSQKPWGFLSKPWNTGLHNP